MSDRGRSRSPEREGERDGGNFGSENDARNSANDHEGKLFLKNLSWNIREDDLKEEFGKFGPIAEIKLPTDNFSGRIKGFGFITFENPNDAKVAKEEVHDKEILGRPIYVDFSTPMEQRPPRPEGGYPRRPPPRSNVCYAWRRGECQRGRDCRFDHFESVRGSFDDRRGGFDDRGGKFDRRDRYDDRKDYRDRYDDRRGGGRDNDRYERRDRDYDRRDRDYDRRDRDYDRRDRSRSRDRGRGDRY